MKNEKGYSLIEVLIAIVVLGIGILALATLQLSSIKGNAFSQHLTEANAITQNEMERLVSLQLTDPDLTSGNHTTTVTGGAAGSTSYAVLWNVQLDTPITNTKRINLTTTWNESGVQHSVQMSFIRSLNVENSYQP